MEHLGSNNWSPETFKVGDVVVDDRRPARGSGLVVEDRTTLRSPSVGQKLTIDFENRGRVLVYTAKQSLRSVMTTHERINAPRRTT